MPIANRKTKKNYFNWAAGWIFAKMHCHIWDVIISLRSCSRWQSTFFLWSENLNETVKSYWWIGNGIGRWEKSSSGQNSCNSICWRQQWQSFSLIGNRSYRKIKTGIRKELHTCELQRRRKRLHTAFLKIRHNKWLPYRSEKSSLSSTQALQWHNYCWNISHYSNEHCQE